MLLVDGVYSIVAYTSVQNCCYVSNERLIFRVDLKKHRLKYTIKKWLVKDYKMVPTFQNSRRLLWY